MSETRREIVKERNTKMATQNQHTEIGLKTQSTSEDPARGVEVVINPLNPAHIAMMLWDEKRELTESLTLDGCGPVTANFLIDLLERIRLIEHSLSKFEDTGNVRIPHDPLANASKTMIP